MSTEKKFLIGCQIVALATMIYCVNRLVQDFETRVNNQPHKFRVFKTYCQKRRSTVSIIQEAQEHWVRFPRKKCEELVPGDSILLYYNKGANEFLVPEDTYQLRAIYCLITFLFWSVIPWSKIWRAMTKSSHLK